MRTRFGSKDISYSVTRTDAPARPGHVTCNINLRSEGMFAAWLFVACVAVIMAATASHTQSKLYGLALQNADTAR